MAFGLFKKNNYATYVFENGNIYTANPEFPWAEACATKDDRIIMVGSSLDMDELKGPDTEVIDLEGKFMYPGFIDCHRSHTGKIFSGKYMDLEGVGELERIGQIAEAYVEENDEKDVIFGYGFDEKLLMLDNEEGFENPLDKIETDKPIVLLSKAGLSILTNQVAKDIVNETAQEENVDFVSANYVLNLLLPFDFDDLEEDFKNYQEDLADQGITTILDLQSPNYMQQFFMDCAIAKYNDELLKQRIFLSYYEPVPIELKGLIYRLDTNKTNCTELGSLIHADTLNIYLDKNSGVSFNEDIFFETLYKVADKGYTFFIEAINPEDLKMAYAGLDYLREKGYKNPVVIASDYELPEEEYNNLLFGEDCYKTFGSIKDDNSLSRGNVENMEDFIHSITIDAAKWLEMDSVLGSIEEGKLADMVVFDKNILNLKKNNKLPQAEMTIMNGVIVHDINAEVDDEIFDMMVESHL